MSAKPRYLYKYSALNMYTMELLMNGELYMATRRELNDPLDALYTLSFDTYQRLYAARYPALAEKYSSHHKMMFDWKSGEDFIDLLESLDEKKYKALKDMRITCFTEDKLNPLMWSHYAQNFTGLCLRFDLTRDQQLHDAVQPVIYADKLVDITSLDDLDKCFVTKLKPWESEKEWRIISEKEKFAFKKEALVEVILGHKAQPSLDGWLPYFLENAYYDARLSRMTVKNNRFVKVDRWGDIISEEVDAEIQPRKPTDLGIDLIQL